MSEPTSRLSTPDWSDSTRTMTRSESTWSTMPSRRHTITAPESRAVTRSMPVPTSGASPLISGTAWRCMFEPINARFASSFSRNGNQARGHRYQLLRRNVDVIHFFAALQHEVTGLAAVDEFGGDRRFSSSEALACATT